MLPNSIENQALGQGVEIAKVIGREHLALDNREVDLDLIEPVGVNRSMRKSQVTIAVSKTLDGLDTAVGRAIVDDPENPTGVLAVRLGLGVHENP